MFHRILLPALDEDGVYVGGLDGRVYAFGR